MVGRHGDGHGLHAAQAEGLADADGLFGEEGVLVVDVQVLLVSVGAVVGIEFDGGGRQQVDVTYGDHAALTHLDVGGGTIGDGHEAAESGQVGCSGVGGQGNACAGFDDIACVAVVSDVEDFHVLQRMAHSDARAGALLNGEAFLLGSVAKRVVARLRVQCQG